MKKRSILRLLGAIVIAPIIVGATACSNSNQALQHSLITITTPKNGKVEVLTPDGEKVGATALVVVTPNEGYYCEKVIHNGYDLKLNSEGKYPFTIEKEKNQIMAFFKQGGGNSGSRSELFDSQRTMNMASRAKNKGSVEDYYEPVRGLKGKALKDKLFEICQPQYTFSYDDLRNSFPITDQDPDSPGTMRLFYTGERYTKFNGDFSYINREHVWPDKRGAGKSGLGSDKHMQRPTEQGINGTRSNCDFGIVEGGKILTGKNAGNKVNYNQGTKYGIFEPKDEFKGDVARIIFYCATVYSKCELDAPDLNRSNFNYWTSTHLHGDFDALYKWATDPSIDPVDKYEMHRNNQVDKVYQENRNPFIDHPEFVEMIYSKSYSGKGALND